MKTSIEKMYDLVIDILSGKIQCAEKLRFERKYLIVSEIAQQFYCEHKLSLMYREGKVETEEKKLGTIIHEEVFKGRSITLQELLDKILTCKMLVATMPIATMFCNVPILGIPDAIVFYEGEATHVIELKTTNRWVGKVFTCEYVQAQLYSYILVREKVASNSELVVSIVKLRRNIELTDELRLRIIRKVQDLSSKLAHGAEHVSLRGQDYSIFLYHYDPSIEGYLSWALGYWRMSREEYIPQNPAKCIRCEYRHLCKYSRIVLNKVTRGTG